MNEIDDEFKAQIMEASYQIWDQYRDKYPAEIMDMSFAIQALSAKYLVEHRDEISRVKGEMINDVPKEIDQEVARRKLAFWGCEIDTLTPQQHRYLFGE